MISDSLDSEEPILSRREFLKFSAATGFALLIEKLPPDSMANLDQVSRLVEQDLSKNPEIISSGETQLLVSREKPGIIDIHSNQRLVNNLVLLAKFESKTRTYFNNAEIQGEKNPNVLRVFKDSENPDEAIVVYTFNQQETDPVSHPAGDVVIILRLGADNKGGVDISTEKIAPIKPRDGKEVENVNLGLGTFFGVHYQTKSVVVETISPSKPAEKPRRKTLPLEFPESVSDIHQYREMGYFTEPIYRVTAVTQNSYSLNNPTIKLSIPGNVTRPVFPKTEYGSVEAEIRSQVWKEDQEVLKKRLLEVSQKPYWFEAVILWQHSSHPSWRLALSAQR